MAETMTGIPAEPHDDLEKLERKHADNPEGRYFVPLANAYRRAGRIDQAEALLRVGLEKHPQYLSAHIVLGRCLADRGERAAAEEEFRYVLSLDQQNLIALRTLGELAVADGRVGDGRLWYEELLAVDPMNEDARRVLDSLPAETAFEARPDEADVEGESPVAPPFGRVGEQPDSPEAADGAPVADDYGAPYGTTISLDEDAGGEEAFRDEGVAVVTETIAELYTRQGFFDRAADVYRELIRRRGGDEGLQERLEHVERLARSGGEEAAVEGAEPLEAAFSGGESDPPEATLEGAREDEGALSDSPWAGERTEDYDVFAASFEAGFEAGEPESEIADHEGEPAVEAWGEEGRAEGQLAGLVTPDGQPVAEEGEPGAEAEYRSALPEGEARPSIREYLRGVAAWSGEAPPEATAAVITEESVLPDEESADEGEEPPPLGLETFGGYDLPEVEQAPEESDRGDTAALGEPAGGPAFDDEPFPWELPEEEPEGEGAEPEEATAPPASERVEAFSFEEFREIEIGGSPGADEEAPEGRPGASAGYEPETAEVEEVADDTESEEASPAEDDDDLESFQAWLRSLKR
jgi:tetratricopeptide (TPR) repeat protein